MGPHGLLYSSRVHLAPPHRRKLPEFGPRWDESQGVLDPDGSPVSVEKPQMDQVQITGVYFLNSFNYSHI